MALFTPKLLGLIRIGWTSKLRLNISPFFFSASHILNTGSVFPLHCSTQEWSGSLYSWRSGSLPPRSQMVMSKSLVGILKHSGGSTTCLLKWALHIRMNWILVVQGLFWLTTDKEKKWKGGTLSLWKAGSAFKCVFAWQKTLRSPLWLMFSLNLWSFLGGTSVYIADYS